MPCVDPVSCARLGEFRAEALFPPERLAYPVGPNLATSSGADIG
jgi:hypothetical protein